MQQKLENERAGARVAAPGDPAAAGQAPAGSGAEAAEPADALFRVTRVSMAYRYFFVILLTLVGGAMLYLLAPSYFASKDRVVMIILGIWSLALLRYWVYLLDMPYQVLFRGDGFLAFRSVFRKRVVLAASVVSMTVSPIYPTYVRFRTEEKKRIPMINHVDGMSDLVGRIRKANPALETRGL